MCLGSLGGGTPTIELVGRDYAERAVDRWNRREPMTQAEVALICGRSIGWVYKIEMRAMEKIRAALEAAIGARTPSERTT